ncbi:hypothetical protein Glove_535g30 [Diversispora epigaea]|uniref:MARVEL domain-containing protein n=1 Tax=Diversispora epigaea TaxID=1348612 RepID=A0A397GD86_9GLOM|nr:hypothetical protein Glove_535g30 [Diversispora epigaea]
MQGIKRGICLYLLIVPNIILTFLCPALEIAKIELFNQTNGELIYNPWVEYLYLTLTWTVVVIYIIVCCCCCFRINIYWLISVAAIIWLIFPLFYTYFTINEMNDIPETCPSDYPYQDSITLTACQIRLANLICMWLYYVSLVLIIPIGWSLKLLASGDGLLNFFNGDTRRYNEKRPSISDSGDVVLFNAESPIDGSGPINWPVGGNNGGNGDHNGSEKFIP